MSGHDHDSFAADCERILKLLANNDQGLSIEEISRETGWSMPWVNGLLCDMRPRIAHETVRDKGRKVVKYRLKTPR